MEKIPFLYRMIRGAVGKEYVIKHYKGGRIVKTRFPDMSGIVPTEKQRVRRNLFREAVVYAKWIIGDEERKRAFRKTLPRKKRKNVYQAVLQLYMKERGSKLWLRRQLAVMAMVESGRMEVVVQEGISNKQWVICKVWIGKNQPVVKKRLLMGGRLEQQGQWNQIWSKKDLADTIKLEVKEQDVGWVCN